MINTPQEMAREERRQARMAAVGATDLHEYSANVVYGWPSPELWGEPTPAFATFEEAVAAGHTLATEEVAKGRRVINFHVFQPRYSPGDNMHVHEAIAAYDFDPTYEVDEARDLGLV